MMNFRSKQKNSGLHPADQHLAHKIVVGDHSKQSPDSQPEIHKPEGAQFHPPQEVAAADEQKPETSTAGNISTEAPKKHRRSFKEWIKSLTKKQWIIIGIIAAVLLIGGGIGTYFLLHKQKPVTTQKTTKKSTPAPQPTTVASNLTGIQTDPSINQRPVTAVMIENSYDSRPQSGLNEAGIVFEAIAEGGITRFVALWQDNLTSYIGPVRSVRTYYIQWAMAFDAAIAHVGGSAEGLQNMRDWNVKDLDQFANSNYYHRISSRYAPHNVYTSIAELNDLESKKGYGAAKYTSWPRKTEQPMKTPQASSIDINISSATFNSHYDYNPATNSYKRSQGGGAHMVVNQDGVETQIEPKVVLALVMDQGNGTYGTIGSGYMYAFQDGRLIEGTWKKDSNSGQFTFADLNNHTIKLNPGQTWVTVVGSQDRVVYKP